MQMSVNNIIKQVTFDINGVIKDGSFDLEPFINNYCA